MSKYSTLKAEIIASIKRNGAQAITGDLLQEKLLAMIDSLGEFYQFGGLALPSTEFTPGDEPVVFIAATPGTYTNFGGLVVADGEVALLVWDGSAWSKQTTDIATRSEVSQLGQITTGLGGFLNSFKSAKTFTEVSPTITELSGKYIDYYGRILDASGYTIYSVDVVGGEFYRISGDTSPIGNVVFAFYHNNDVVGVYNDTTRVTDYIIYIPNGANKLYVQKKNYTASIVKIIPNDDKVFLNGIYSSDANIISQTVGYETEIISTTVLSNKYFDGNVQVQDIVSQDDYTIYSVDCQDFDYFAITAKNVSGLPLYVFYNSDGEIISYYKKDGLGTLGTDTLIKAPYGATRLSVQGKDGIGGIKKANINSAAKKWSSKKWVVVGDSLTEVNSAATKRYYDFVSEKTGINVYNMGVSGTGYKRSYEDNAAFYQRIANVPLDADVITIFGSGNDNPYYVNDLGTESDTGTTTIGGCINTTIDTLLNLLPLANVALVTPTPWKGKQPDETTGQYLENYSELIVKVAKRRGLPYLDLYHCSGLHPSDAACRALAYSKDGDNGVHPDENGHKIIAPKFYALLDSMLL
jgi:lysophospholipase L1-like esterase